MAVQVEQIQGFNSFSIHGVKISQFIRFAILIALLTSSNLHLTASAQSELSFDGLAYVDYNYVLAAPDSAEGENGFTYRRIYFTANYKISETFSGRLRFEVSNSSTTAQGRPAPFVKDMYLTWNNIWGKGHSLTLGVTSPPSFTVTEKIWGYRSLEKTILDRNKIVSSRDFGIVAKGPLSSNGKLKYALMLANNEGVRQEDDKNKRIYTQIEWYPSDPLSITVGLDYAKLDDGLTSGLNFPVFIGYKNDNFSAGVEAFTYMAERADGRGDETQSGVTVFGTVALSDETTLIARFDYREVDPGVMSYADTYTILGVAFRPHKNVRFIPNLEIEGDDRVYVNGRLTVHVDFK